MSDKDADDRVIVDIYIKSKDDKKPLTMIRGEQKEKWQAIERIARRIVQNRHLATENIQLGLMLDALVVVFAMPED